MTKLTTAERMMRLETNLTNLDKKVEDGFTRIDTNLATISAQIQAANADVGGAQGIVIVREYF